MILLIDIHILCLCSVYLLFQFTESVDVSECEPTRIQAALNTLFSCSIWLTAFLYLGDLVSPGLFKDHLTTQDTSWSYHDSGEGYIYEFAVNLETLDYLQTINILKTEQLNLTLEYMTTST